MNVRDRMIVDKICSYVREIKETHAFFGQDEGLFLDRDRGFVYRNAVTMPILQIGELAKNLTDSFRREYDGLPWKDIMGMRDVFAHHYGSIDYNMVWRTSLDDVNKLLEYLEKVNKEQGMSDNNLSEKRKRVFSGVQPTGNIHIGNYLGALKQFVELQDENDCVYCVVDMHALTLPKDPKELKKHVLDVAALYMAVGLDPKKATLFVQSDVAAHAELSWILTCSSYTGELSRMTQFKDKSRNQESAPTGLFCYPVLMAADILLYDTDIVPVGNDQKQHIELTRDLAIRINNRFDKKVFVVPEGKFMKAGARIMALDDPSSKMSKSAENELSRISLLDDEAKIKKAIMRAQTDSEPVVRFDPEKKPGISNLLTIYSAFSGLTIEQLEKDYEGHGYGDLKKDLVTVTVDALRPIRERFSEIRASEELQKTLKDGAEAAGALAERTMKRVRKTFGLGAAR